MNKKRSEGLDLIRSIAILSVVLIHCLRCIQPLDSISIFNSMSTFEQIFYFTSYTLGSIGVPLFFLLTGYLILHRDFDSPINFYKRNLLPLLITWELWIIPNNLLAKFYYDVPFHFSTVIKNMLFIEPVFIGHSWYMPVIIGIYILIPFVAKAIQSFDVKNFLLPCSISYVFFSLLPSTNLILNKNWHLISDLNFPFGLYLSYVILGYILYKFKIESSLKFIPLILILISLTSYLQIFIHQSSQNIFHLWYDFFTLPLIAIFIFILLHEVKFNLHFIGFISKCSFGIYIIHVFFIGVILKFNLLEFIDINELKILTLTVLVYMLSFISVLILKQIPLVGKYLVR